jgi:hypothetical protein
MSLESEVMLTALPFSLTVQRYRRLLEFRVPSQFAVKALEVSNSPALLLTVRSARPGMTTVGMAAFPGLITTVLVTWPQLSRKLHSRAVTVRLPDACARRRLGTTVGARKVKLRLRNASTPEASPLLLLTVNTGVVQALPPAPVEADRSIDRPAQLLMTPGTLIITTGEAGEAGAETYTVLLLALVQPLHTLGSRCPHAALRLLSPLREIELLRPITVAAVLLGSRDRVDASNHWHTEVPFP